MAFGWVVDDGCADKVKAGGAGEFALSLADAKEEPDGAAHAASCGACRVLGEPLACLGLIPSPIPAAVERWLVERLPVDIESLPGFLLRKAIGDFGYDGSEGKRLRGVGMLAAPGPFTRHFGPFFRRFTVSSEQLVEEMLCAGDVDPAHGLAILVHLSLIAVDGALPLKMEDGQKLGALIGDPASRASRTACLVEIAADEDSGLVPLKRFLRGLWAGFVEDAPVKVFGGEMGDEAGDTTG